MQLLLFPPMRFVVFALKFYEALSFVRQALLNMSTLLMSCLSGSLMLAG